MKKLGLVFLFVLCCFSFVFAQEEQPSKDFLTNFVEGKLSAGGTLGANMNSSEGWALEWGIHADYQIIENLKAGISLDMSYDFSEIFVVEPTVYAKYYLPFISFVGFTPFAQVDLGASILSITDVEKAKGLFLAGISAGLNYKLGNVYIEPRFSFGYPYMLAFDVSVGYSF